MQMYRVEQPREITIRKFFLDGCECSPMIYEWQNYMNVSMCAITTFWDQGDGWREGDWNVFDVIATVL